MKSRLCLVCFAFVALLAFAPAARAQRLVFERGDALYASGEDGIEPRKLLTLGGAKPGTVRWAVSHDGRRLAWLVQTGDGDQPDFASRPATVYVADMLTTRHQKKLFSTSDLRDRLGRKVGGLGAGDAPGKWENWQPVSLGWSADSRTLYVGGEGDKTRATFAVDAASGAALVNADGNWKSVAPLAQIDADGGLLVGLSPYQTRPAPESASGVPDTDSGVIEVVNLVEATRTPLWKLDKRDGVYPEPPFLAQGPALHPDHRRIAYASATVDGGLYLVDRFTVAGAVPRRLLEGTIRRPRWSSDGKRVLFLYLRPGVAAGSVYDLYDLVVADKMPTPRLLLQSVAWFDDTTD